MQSALLGESQVPQQEWLPAAPPWWPWAGVAARKHEARAYKQGRDRGAGAELLLRVYTGWKVDPPSSTYVRLIVVKQGFDCKSSGRNLAGKS